jgi:peptidoglycan-N-acetylglucosamine deacetylase
MSKNKPIASLSLDLDNQWSYMKTHGDPGWETFPSYLDLVVPRILELLKDLDLTITFFIVGQDAALEKNQRAIRMIAEAGHEIGNHSYNHEPWLQFYTEQQIEEEVVMAEECIKRITAFRPVGFRGPGYSISSTLLNVLERRGYQYDASILSTFLGPIARFYYFMTSRLSNDEKQKRALLFGRLQDGFRPNHPYKWENSNFDLPSRLNEIPVTTMPVFRLPFHMSYILYISQVSPLIALSYFRFAIALCLWTGTQPSLLLHPLDFVGGDEVKELSFFPAMDLPTERKLSITKRVLAIYKHIFDIKTMQQHSLSIALNARSININRYFEPVKEP